MNALAQITHAAIFLFALNSSASARQVFGPPRDRAEPITIVEVEAHGDIALVDADGVRSIPKTGSFELWTRYDLTWHLQEIAVVDGHWSAQVPSPIAWAVVERVVLDGREAYVERGGWDGIPPAENAWTARLVAPVQLNVVDLESGEAIRGFEVREWDLATPPLDANDGWIAKWKGSGTFTLPVWSLDPEPEPLTGHAWKAKRAFWIRAENRAWARVEADSSRGGTVVARLARAASLRAVVSPNTASKRNGEPLIFQLELGGYIVTRGCANPRELELTNLNPGDVTLRWLVPNESLSKPPRVLAVRQLRLEAGRTTTVEF